MSQLYIIGGANGSGKTTTATKLLPEFLSCNEFVNADVIASGLSAFNPGAVSIEAGRLMLKRIHHLLTEKTDFAFETTFASRTFVPMLNNAKAIGYSINVLYLWLNSPELAIERVKKRVSMGGHSVPEEIIRRRYESGRMNFLNLYLPAADRWFTFDNSGEVPVKIAEGGTGIKIMIYKHEVWSQIMKGSI